MAVLLRILLALEALGALVTGACWAAVGVFGFVGSMPRTVPLSLHELLWMPLVAWAVPFVLARLPMSEADISSLTESIRRRELVYWGIGFVCGVPLSLALYQL